MKIYTQTYDLAKASPHRFWVAPFSEFKIGIKILEKDEISSKDFTLKAGSIEFTPDADKIDNFTLFTIKSNDTGFVDYTIEVEGVAEKLKLMQIVTDSTVFEIDASGGDVPADVATQTWVNSQISDFITEDALTSYVPLTGNVNMTGSLSVSNDSNGVELDVSNGVTVWDIDEGKRKAISLDYDGLFVKDYNDTAAKEIEYPTKSGTMVVDADLTAYYTKSETSSAVELAEAFAGAGGAISAFDMSENPVWSKAIVEAALNSNTCLPQTIAHYTNGSISAFNIVGQMNNNNFVAANADKVIIGSNVSSMSLPFNVGGSNSVLKEVIFSPQVTNVTLKNCYELTSVIFPKDSKVSYLDESSFQGCRSLSSLSLPNNIGNDVPWQQSYNAIGLNTFNGCTSLKYLRIPDSVKKIARTQFTNLSCAIDYGNTRTDVPTLGAYGNGASKCYVPDNLYDQWIATSQWSAGVSAIYRQSDLYAPYATSKAEDAYNMAEGAIISLGNKVDHNAGGMAPEVLNITTYYESEYTQLSVDDPTWEPDPNTMYVILPDQV